MTLPSIRKNPPPLVVTTEERLAADAVKTAMLRQRLRRSDLAREIAIPCRLVSAVIGGFNKSRRNRWAIECFLREPFWSTPADFVERTRLQALLGVDVYSATMAELRAILSEKGVTVTRADRRSRRKLLASVLATFPAPTTPPPASSDEQVKT